MLPQHLVSEIEDRLDEGVLSQRQIAERLRVSRGTVHLLANGRRQCQTASLAEPAERCGSCGSLVHLPCVGCQAEAFLERQQRSRRLRDRYNRRSHRAPVPVSIAASGDRSEPLPPPYSPVFDTPPVRHAA